LTVTVDMWQKMTSRERVFYRLVRSPLLILFGYLTVFLYGMCISSYLRNHRKCWDSLLAVIVHFGLLGAIWYFAGPLTMVLTLLLPLAISHAMGAYLFYAQHNFVGVHLQPRHEWNFTRSAIESSSFMKLGPIMNWFTGNIGYHHVHHLNHRIPFYRLPEALDALEPLRDSKVTSLWPWDVAACLKLKVWDPKQGKLLSYREVNEALPAEAS
jgi:omega-6 fatty acid desaturase (delta-12 desaturase)